MLSRKSDRAYDEKRSRYRNKKSQTKVIELPLRVVEQKCEEANSKCLEITKLDTNGKFTLVIYGAAMIIGLC